MIDIEKTIISQYGNSATITQLIQFMNQYIDPRADFEQFYNYVWNVETAQGFGLDIWGKIVGVGRELNIPSTNPYFGFNEGLDYFPFNEGTFYNGENQTQVYTLADDAYRQLILVKALANISATTAPAINQLLQNLFPGRGRSYVNDLGNMQMRYTFEFPLEPFEYAIVTQSGALLRPAGVLTYIAVFPFPNIFGFSEAGSTSAPFDEGVFLPPESIAYAN